MCTFGSERERLQLQERREKDRAVPTSPAPGAIGIPLHHTHETATQHTSLCPLLTSDDLLNILTLRGVVQEGHWVVYSRLGAPTS